MDSPQDRNLSCNLGWAGESFFADSAIQVAESNTNPWIENGRRPTMHFGELLDAHEALLPFLLRIGPDAR